MKAALAGLAAAALAGLLVALPAITAAQSREKVDFARDIQPLLRANCYGCHGPAQQNGSLRLDRRRDALPNRVGANGARIVPGNSAGSRLYQRVSGSQAGLLMPPTGPLRPEEIATIAAWIDQGADWPDELAGDAPSPPKDAMAARLMDALRSGDRPTFERLLAANPKSAGAAGSGGTTPLMYAALYQDAAAVRRLLEMGVDPNARNEAGATALLWAVDNIETTRLLLDRGADANARSADGQTPLVLAAGRAGSSDVLTLLLQRGAKLDPSAINQAADTGDAALIRLLLDRGAGATPLSVDLALRSGCDSCAEMLLSSASPPALSRALESAARFGDTDGFRRLLDRGVEPTSAALRAAAASERVPLDMVATMLARGIRDDGALELALRLGDTPVVAALRKAGATAPAVPVVDLKRPAAMRSARAAIHASLPLLQRSDVGFLKGAGCVSCHNNSLFQMTAAAVRRKRFRIDEAAFQSQLATMGAYIESWRERVLQDIAIPGRIDTNAYILLGLAAAQYPPDAATDAMARYVLRRQSADGGWRIAAHRPPIESSSAAMTAVSIRSLQAFAPAPLKGESARAVQRAVVWLTRAQLSSTEDHAFQVLGLSWAGAGKDDVGKAVGELVALQRDDGGWSQLPSLASDAYATGQALTALAEAGTAATDPAYQRGVRFLLGGQLEDGSWYVRSRALPIQPYFESGFPHGRDQFISAAATSWATMALAATVR